MPTGYTADIYDHGNVSFKDFALRCARAFGAAVSQRDDPLDAELKLPEVEAYYFANVKTAHDEVQRVLELSDGDWDNRYRLECASIETRNELNSARAAELKERYETLTRAALKWEPPTELHLELKDFMLEQLKSSAEKDTALYIEQPPSSAEDFKHATIQTAIGRLNRALEALKGAEARVAGQRKWLTELIDSLGDS